ncbi:unnamed protein product [Eruca vesicaria subsp. sativa]|uniref:Transcription factor TFIIB cyclin-like domain-containing protein n=1 Tax=Eruca vesicaria subsp. sativa TaxID=29727 RepID=A0ABC8J8C9_ERUVS|nr:unnamed protein product [Eruca vesicaria subsp. sativa]
MTNVPSKRGISSILGDFLLKSGDDAGKTVAREGSGVKFSKRLCLVVDDLVKESTRTCSDTNNGSSDGDKISFDADSENFDVKESQVERVQKNDPQSFGCGTFSGLSCKQRAEEWFALEMEQVYVLENQATEISEQIKGQIAKRNVRFAASIYISCRQNGIALSIREISTVSNGAEESKITSAVKSVADRLGLTPQLMHIRAVEFAKRYSTELEMDSEAVKAAEEAAEKCTKHVKRYVPK